MDHGWVWATNRMHPLINPGATVMSIWGTYFQQQKESNNAK